MVHIINISGYKPTKWAAAFVFQQHGHYWFVSAQTELIQNELNQLCLYIHRGWYQQKRNRFETTTVSTKTRLTNQFDWWLRRVRTTKNKVSEVTVAQVWSLIKLLEEVWIQSFSSVIVSSSDRWNNPLQLYHLHLAPVQSGHFMTDWRSWSGSNGEIKYLCECVHAPVCELGWSSFDRTGGGFSTITALKHKHEKKLQLLSDFNPGTN